MIFKEKVAPSGVGIQARYLFDGLVSTGKYSFRCLGGAIKHGNYDTVAVNPDFIIKPVDGFGTKEMIRSLLYTEQPDAVFIFTDPRQFVWLYEMEDEIRQICPLAYWHIWDNDPYPKFNYPWYESTDLINCISWKTYELVKPNFPSKTNYIPHAFPKNVYFPLPKDQIDTFKKQNFGNRADWFQVLWVNRNATRKMPADLLDSWKLFLDKLEQKHGHRNATLIMHTDPGDIEGPNLLAVSEELGLQGNVWFSTEKLGFDQINIMHNITDTCINISKNEGHGLNTHISLQVGKPIIALTTGGETRQVIDYRDGSEHGVGIKPIKRSLVGSQLVPYIFEDFCSQEQVAEALMKIYEMTPEEKDAMREKNVAYCDHEFNYEKMISEWDRTLTECIENFKKEKEEGKRKRWGLFPVNPLGISMIDAKEGDSINVPSDGSNHIESATKVDKEIRSALKTTKIERKRNQATK